MYARPATSPIRASSTLRRWPPNTTFLSAKRRWSIAMKSPTMKLAKKAKDLASLGEVAPDALKVVVTKPFSWMTSGGFGMFGRPELTQVPEINLPGQEFMRAVFALQAGQTGAAPNQAHSKVYVV